MDSLYAREAFIDRLNTADITANQYLKLALDAQQATLDENTGRLDTVSRYITFSAEGMRQRQSGSVYSTLVNDTGFRLRPAGFRVRIQAPYQSRRSGCGKLRYHL